MIFFGRSSKLNFQIIFQLRFCQIKIKPKLSNKLRLGPKKIRSKLSQKLRFFGGVELVLIPPGIVDDEDLPTML